MADYDGGSASVRIRPNMSRFSTELDAELRRVQATIEVAARIGEIDDAELIAWRARQEANSVTIRVDTDTSQIDRAIQQLSRNLGGAGGGGGFGGGFSPTTLLWGLSPALIDPVIASVGTLSTSVLQLAESALVLPGVLGGVAASLGTFTVGVDGLKDAYSALEKAQDGTRKSAYEADKAMATLAPNARDFLTTFMDVKQEFLDNDVQQNLFTELGTSLRNLTNADLPILKTGMESIATGLNSNIRALFDSLGSSQGQGILERILGNTSEAQARFAVAIDPIVRGVGTLVAAGTDKLPRIADAIAGVSERIAAALERADQDGSLSRAMDEGLDALGHLLDIAKNLGDAFVSIARAAGGEGFLGTVDKLTERFADWLKTAEGQRQVREWFDDAKRSAAEWLPILQQLPGMIQGVIEAGRDIASVLVPVLREVSEFLGEHPGLIEAAVVAFAAFGTITGVATLITSLQTISTLLRVTLVADAAIAGAGIAAGLARALPVIGLIYGAYEIGKQNPLNADQNGTKLPDGTTVYGPGPDGSTRKVGPDGKFEIYGPDGKPFRGALVDDEPDRFPPPPDPKWPGGNGPHGSPHPNEERRPPSDGILGGGGGFAAGGYTDWPVSQGVPALLHGREFVQQASAVAKYGVPFMSALNEGRVDPRALPAFDTGGYVDPYGNPVTAGAAPGPAQGAGGLFTSFLSGLPGLSNLGGLLGGTNTGQAGTGQYNGFSNPLASVPGLIGLFGGLGGQDPDNDLMQWGTNTGKWLGQFTANAGIAFGTTLWQGLLGMVGLDNSFLSPNNPYNRDLMQSMGYYGDLSGSVLGGGRSGSSRQTSAKQMREAMERISDRDSQVAIAEARLRELPPYASDSQRLSAQAAVDKANREAADARLDLQSLQQGGGTVLANRTSAYSVAPTAGAGAERWRPVVMQALQQLGPSRGITNYQGWADALIGQIDFESKGDPNALNPADSDGMPAIGLSQFKQGTFDAHNVLGGDIHDGTASIYAMIDYVSSRYGQNQAGIPNFINQGHGYAGGGAPKGFGGPTADLIPSWLSSGEHVFSAWEVDAMGGQDAVYAFRAGLHANAVKGYADPGQVYLTPAQQQAWQNAMQYVPTPPSPRPNFDPGRGAQQKIVTPPVSTSTLGSAATAAAPTTSEATPGQQQGQQASGFQLNAPAPSSYDHNLPAVNTAIQSTATTLGNIAATAASMGAGGASMGIGGAASGLSSSMIQGGAQQIGKIAKNVANVFSSFGVGNLTMGDPTASVYGTPAISAQRQPDTMGGRGGGDRPLSFYGMQPRDVIREIRTMDAEDSQGSFATL